MIILICFGFILNGFTVNGFRASYFGFFYYNGTMVRFLPFIFLASALSVFGLVWTVWYVNPDLAPWYIFAAVVCLIFTASLGFLGTLLYFLRTKLYRRYSARWYFYTSFKMAFFISAFLALVVGLQILDLLSRLNLFLAISAVILFALWSYLGKKLEK